MTDTEIYAQLTQIFHEVLLRKDLVLMPELTANDVPGWNSFKQVEIILEVEERFGIQMASADIDGFNNVGDLVRTIAAKLGAGETPQR